VLAAKKISNWKTQSRTSDKIHTRVYVVG
jgi:hypothetical protein